MNTRFPGSKFLSAIGRTVMLREGARRSAFLARPFSGCCSLLGSVVLPALVLLPVVALGAGTKALTPEEQSFVDKHMSELVTTKVLRLTEANLTKVFSVPIYQIKVIMLSDDGGTGTSSLVAAQIDDHLVELSPPSTDGDVPKLLKMIDPKFKLSTDADAEVLQAALDALFPPFGSDDKDASKFSHADNRWVFVRGKFFDSEKGFIFETDADGTIIGVKYQLKLQ